MTTPPASAPFELPPLIFGAMARRAADDREREALIRAAVDLGITAIDTAPLYDFGRCEAQIGRALRGVPRDRVQLLTKVGLRWDGQAHGRVLFSFTDTQGGHSLGGHSQGGHSPGRHSQGRQVDVKKDSRPEAVRDDVMNSLKRMNVDYLDLVQIHHPDVDTPIADTLGALLDLRAAGVIRAIGVSNFDAEQVAAAQAALGDVPLCSVQNEYSLLRREVEADLLPHCRRHDIRLLAYSPLAAGALAQRVPQIADRAAVQRLRAARAVLTEIAAAHRASDAAVALAWLMAQPGAVSAVAGASTPQQLADNRAALDIRLLADELRTLDEAFAAVRWPASWEIGDSLARRAARRGRRLVGGALRTVGLNPGRLRGWLSRRS